MSRPSLFSVSRSRAQPCVANPAAQIAKQGRRPHRRGYQFISLAEALRDKAYSLPDAYTGPVGISWLQRWAITKGGPGTRMRPEPGLPLVMKEFDNPSASGSDYKTGQPKK